MSKNNLWPHNPLPPVVDQNSADDRRYLLLRYGQQRGLFRKSTQECLTQEIPTGGVPIELQASFHRAGGGEKRRMHSRVRGYKTCRNTNSCPICTPLHRKNWAQKITNSAYHHLGGYLGSENGPGLYARTLTLPHYQEYGLQGTVDWFQRAWYEFTGGAGGRRREYSGGVQWYFRSLENVHGKNGHHFHAHILEAHDRWLDGTTWEEGIITLPDGRLRQVPLPDKFIARRAVASQDQEVCRYFLRGHERWASAVEMTAPTWARRNGRTPLLYGADFQSVPSLVGGLCGYLAKIGGEFAASTTKNKPGHDGGRSMWTVLTDAIEQGKPQDVAIWKEYVEVASGMHSITHSKGEKNPLRPDDEDDVPLVPPGFDDAEPAQWETVATLSPPEARALAQTWVRGLPGLVLLLRGLRGFYVGDGELDNADNEWLCHEEQRRIADLRECWIEQRNPVLYDDYRQMWAWLLPKILNGDWPPNEFYLNDS